MKFPTWATTVTPFSKAVALTMFIMLPYFGFWLGMNYQKNVDYLNKSTISQSPTLKQSVSPTLNSENNNWKTYTDSQIGFSLQYPSKWEMTTDSSPIFQEVKFEGMEGKIAVAWGSGFGGGCPQRTMQMTINNEQKNVCHGTGEIGETWGQIYWQKNNVTYSLSAWAKSPSESNREMVLKSLNSFMFNPSL